MGAERDLWKATLGQLNREIVGQKGAQSTGRRLVERHGVHHEFERAAEVTETSQRLSFKRVERDGSQRGRTLTIELLLENDQFRMKAASY